MGETSVETILKERELQIEEQKIALEREKLLVEHVKARWAAVAAVLPIVAALGTIIYGVWSLRETAITQFQMKLAEIALSAPDPGQAQNRARIVANWFRGSFPTDVQQRLQNFKPEEYGNVDADSKKELFKAIAQHPDHGMELVAAWKVLFPGDEWVADVGEALFPNGEWITNELKSKAKVKTSK